MNEKNINDILEEENLGFSTDSAYSLADRGKFSEAYRFISEYERVNGKGVTDPIERSILSNMYNGIRKYIAKKESEFLES